MRVYEFKIVEVKKLSGRVVYSVFVKYRWFGFTIKRWIGQYGNMIPFISDDLPYECWNKETAEGLIKEAKNHIVIKSKII